jgi:hypothetical protein
MTLPIMTDKEYEELLQKLVTEVHTVSELSDEMCRKVLRYLIRKNMKNV